MPMISVYCSTQTIVTLDAELDSAIRKYVPLEGGGEVEEALVRAICKHESQNYKFAYRDDTLVLKDQKWVKDAIAKGDLLNKYGPQILHSCGYMQMLYIVAICEYGFTGTIENMASVHVSIPLGIKHIRRLLKRYNGNVQDAISAYNQGYKGFEDLDKDGIKDPNEKYYNQGYVDDVYANYKKFGGKQ